MIATLRTGTTRLTAWWLGRTQRERLLVGAMAVTALAYVLTAAVVRPLATAHADALASIARSDAALARLAALPADAAAPKTRAPDQPATAVLTATAPDFGMTIRRIEPEGDGARVTIDDAAYADILRWILALENDHGLHLSAIEMDRRPDPGIVSATMTLQR